MNTSSEPGVKVFERVADLLEVLGNGNNEMGITDLGNKLGLGKSTVHRLLTSMEKRGYVQQNQVNKKYQLGPTVMRLGLVKLRQLDARELALPWLERLRDATNETTTFSLKIDRERMYVLQVESRQEIRQTIELGRAYPLYLGATGKAILAFVPPEEQASILEQAGPDLATRQRERQELEDDLAEIARRGYALSRGERTPDAASVAAPIFDYNRHVVGAMSVAGPITRLTIEKQVELAARLLECSTGLSRQLGGS